MLQKSEFTKRYVLSQVACIYDPLGLLGPVIIKVKIFMQQLWLVKIEWSERLLFHVSKQWETFIKTFTELESIGILKCFLISGIEWIY